MTLNPFRLAYALLAAIVVAGAVLFCAEAGVFGSGASCGSPALSSDPLVATRTFVTTAVAREHLDRSYALVTDSLRQGMSCGEWLTGTIPVQPFLQVVPERSAYRVVARSHDGRTVLVHLVSRSPEWPATTFLLELRAVGGGWLVSSFTPTGGTAVPAA